MLLTHVPEMNSIHNKVYHLQNNESFSSDVFMTTDNEPFFSLTGTLNKLFLHSQLNYRYCLLTIDCNTVAIFKSSCLVSK